MLLSKLNSLKNYQLLILFLFAGLISYSISLNVTLFGDEISFIQRTQINSTSDIVHAFDKKEFDSDYYRPVVNFFNGILTLFFGDNIFYYRIFNALLHGFNAFIVFLFSSMLLFSNPNNKFISLTAGFFFLLFPLHDLAVIWHTDLFDRLLMPLYFLTIIFYIRKQPHHPLAFLFFLLSLLSKEMSFSLPFSLLISDYFILQNKIKKSLLNVLPFASLLILFLIVRYFLFDNNVLISDRTHPDTSIFGIVKNVSIFIGLLSFPFFTDTIQILFKSHPIPFLIGGSVTAVAAAFFIYRIKSERTTVIFLMLLLLIILMPASRLVMKWYLYLPSVPFLILLAVVLFQFKEVLRKVLVLIFVLCYTASTMLSQLNWVELTHKADSIISEFKTTYTAEIKKTEGIVFITTPAKVNGYPIFQLDFGHHLMYKLGFISEIGILSRCNLSSFDDTIVYTRDDLLFNLSVNRDNYFVLYGIEKNYNFTDKDFKNGLLQNITVKLNEDKTDRLIFTFSEGQFKRIF